MTDELNQATSPAEAAAEAARDEAMRAKHRSDVAEAFPDMTPAEVEAAVALLADDFRPDPGDTTGDAAEGGTTAALAPVIPAALLAIVARCAFGAMAKATLAQLESLIRRNQLAPASDMLRPAIEGCLKASRLPSWVVKVVARVGARVVARAVALAIKARKIRIPLPR